MFDHLLELSHRDNSNKWLNIGCGQEIREVGSIEVNFTHLIWYSVYIAVFSHNKMRPLHGTIKTILQQTQHITFAQKSSSHVKRSGT